MTKAHFPFNLSTYPLSSFLLHFIIPLLYLQGYYNLEQTCHVSIKLTSGQAARFAPVNNIVIQSDMMSCSCSVVNVNMPATRAAEFSCFLFRARCPINHNLGVPVITPWQDETASATTSLLLLLNTTTTMTTNYYLLLLLLLICNYFYY